MRRRTPGLILAAILLLPSASFAADKVDSPFGFTTTIPDGWTIAKPKTVSPFRILYYRGFPESYLSIQVSEPKPNFTEDEALKYYAKTAKMYNPSIVQINKRSWAKIKFDLPGESKDANAVEFVYTTFTNKRFYNFILGSRASDQKSLEPMIDSILKATVFTKPREAEMKRPAAKPERLQPKSDPAEKLPPESTPLPDPEPLPGAGKVDPKPTPDPVKEPALEPQPMPEPTKEPEDKEAEDKVAQGPKDALENRYGSQIVASDGQYDPDLYATKNLTDNDKDTCWRNRAGEKLPQQFIYALQKTVTVTQVEVVNRKDAQFPGISAQNIVFEGADKSKDGPWEPLASFKANEEGPTLQAVDKKKARWIRIRVLSNYGHSTLTQMAGLKVHTSDPLKDYGPADLPKNPTAKDIPAFEITRARLSTVNNGPAHDSSFESGSRVFLNFKPRGMTMNRRGRYWLIVDVEILGDDDKVIVKKDKLVDKIAALPKAPLSIFVSLSVDIPKTFPPGTYKIRWTSHDRLAGKKLSNELSLVISPPKDAPDVEKKGD
ncbi:MAG: discoidin domain-containing protein [Planctomycetota bacterium]|nr:discoidin domain-containing protein [Planctomycetota bacterium]